MAIRCRNIDGTWIALCAAETNPKAEDIYINDALHYALTIKFMDDWQFNVDEEMANLMKKEKVRDAKEELEKWLNEQT